MTMADLQNNRYQVTFFYEDDKYEHEYSSNPFDTEEEARAYMARVLERAAMRPDINLIRIMLVFWDEHVWDEIGDCITIEDKTF